ncbi:MAG: ABC transporter ATP-binding protein [Elusimicrobiota bacterium]|jgi:putative spermidine/putrescine transport system ATP-binding protein|nr:ABC transporter ATP-binding protein [Elusimicrobiota bacterium]
MAQKEFSTLHLDKISRHFNTPGKTFAALDGLTVDIKSGEFLTFLGPSGCGKSTALNCIAGLFPLTSGEIRFDGKRIDTLPPEKRGFGMVFQNYALFPHMTVLENVAFGLLMRKVPKSEIADRVKKALALVQLTDQGSKLPGQLSGGQQQRVAIARAIVIEPPLILMDEPLSNLDAKLRLEMRSEIRRIHHELGRMTIYVTHDQDEALSLADRIVVMNAGKVQQIAPPQEVYSSPATIQVAKFMGYRTVIELDVLGIEGDTVSLSGRGLNLKAKVMQPIKTKKALVAVRPEDFNVGQGENNIPAKIEMIEYCGFSSQITLKTAAGDTIHMRTPAILQENTDITVNVSTNRLLAYPIEEA